LPHPAGSVKSVYRWLSAMTDSDLAVFDDHQNTPIAYYEDGTRQEIIPDDVKCGQNLNKRHKYNRSNDISCMCLFIIRTKRT
jgi:hypothetical protein